MRTVLRLAVSIAIATGARAEPPVYAAAHPHILLNGALYQRLHDQLTAGSPAATRFRNMVDGQLAGADHYGYEPWYSAMIGVLTGQAKYCADAVARTEAFVTSEEALIAGGQVPVVAGDSYLYVGELVGNVALVYDWCWSNLNPGQRSRWSNYANRAVSNVWDPAHAQWNGVVHAWSGWSIDNPVNNYYYSFLRATMLLGLATKYERADADTWLTQFRTVKIANQLVPTFNADLGGGGSREGTGYGSAMRGLFNLYWMWEASTGERLADLTPHTAASLPYFMHAVLPTRDRFAPIGDHARESSASLYDYQREYLLALATLYNGSAMARRARSEQAQSTLPEMSSGFNFVYDFLYDVPDAGDAAPLNTAYRGSGTGHVFMRSAWTTDATWLAQMTGPYTESHAHQDGLSFLLYKGGWLVSDANIDSHSGIVQGQEAHALVSQRVGGQLLTMVERPSSTANLTALAQRPEYAYTAADVGSLFADRYTGVSPVESARQMVFLKPDVVIIHDRVRYPAGVSTKTFQLPTPYLPTISSRSATWNNGAHTLHVHAVAPAASTLSVTSMPALDPDFNGGYRFDSTVTGSGETRFVHVLAIDNAVSSVTGNDSGTVSITLGDGRTATISFGTSGGHIELRNAGNQLILAEDFATSVSSLPLGDTGDVPGAPLLQRLIPGSGRLRLHFTPPVSDGGQPVTGYIASCNNGGNPHFQSGPASPLTVTGLTNGTTYRCNVRASNVNGNGPVSIELERRVSPLALPALLPTLLGN
jgi:hypothetical protein